MSKALLGKSLDEEVIVKTNGITARYFVTSVEYK
jgi:transcription elongation GreA/GreB family factor